MSISTNEDFNNRQHLVAEAARFDNTKSGQNRHRYLRDAWRDFSKAVEYAVTAAGADPATVESAEKTEPAPNPEAETGSPSKADTRRQAPRNEAKSPCDDRADSAAVTPLPAAAEPLEDHLERR